MVYTPTVIGGGLSGYAFLTRTRETQQAQLAQSPQIARQTEAFTARIDGVQTPQQLLDDRALLSVALGAFGLDEDIDNRAFLEKILTSDLSDRGSLANRLADKRYLAFARAFNFMGDGGPTFAGAKGGPAILDQLAGLQRADDLLSDPPLLRATLSVFGLEADAGNTYFLQQVLESDLSDPDSFANRLGNPRYAELSAALGLGDKALARETVYGFADTFNGIADDIRTADDLIADPALVSEALRIFGLDAASPTPDFLRDVLNSDLTDPNSTANAADDPRYAALADLFGFAERAAADLSATPDDPPFISKLSRVAATIAERGTQVETREAFFADPDLILATFDLFDLPRRTDQAAFVARILDSDPDNPTSLVNVFPDPRYRALAEGFRLAPEVTERVYPAGFADAIVESYLDRQFEIKVGEIDPALRVAISMERDLAQVLETGSTNDARWFFIMASKPLRSVFEGVFGLPTSFGALDLDRQVSDLKERSERAFGTSDVAALTARDTLDEIRRRYLFQTSLTAQAPQNPVLSLLSSAER